MSKKAATFTFQESLLEKLANIAKRRATTRGRVLEDLIATADEHHLSRTLYVESVDPWVVSGERWEGKFTGYLRMVYPNGSDLRSVEKFVSGLKYENAIDKVVLEYTA